MWKKSAIIGATLLAVAPAMAVLAVEALSTDYMRDVVLNGPIRSFAQDERSITLRLSPGPGILGPRLISVSGKPDSDVVVQQTVRSSQTYVRVELPLQLARSTQLAVTVHVAH